MDRIRPIHLLYAALLLAGGAVSSISAASTEGRLGVGKGASSSGSARVVLEVPDMVKLSGVDDLVLSWNAGQGGFSATDGLCVYRNGAGTYSVTASSQEGATGQFIMRGESGSAVSYEVSWNGEALPAGQRSAVRSDADSAALDCGGGNNVSLSVSASVEQVSQASVSGAHRDTLTLEIIAE